MAPPPPTGSPAGHPAEPPTDPPTEPTSDRLSGPTHAPGTALGEAGAPLPARGPRGYLALVAKGFAMGTADVIPGVSGGTMALILGIYRELIGALGALSEAATLRAVARLDLATAFRRVRGGFLLALALGIGAALLLLSGALHWLLEHHRTLVYAFFFGLIAASAWLVGKRVGSWTSTTLLALAAAAVGAFVLVGLTPTRTPETPLVYALSGAVAICALVLPGISGAFILVLLGKYEQVLAAVSRLDLLSLLPFALGAGVGLLGFARVLAWLLRRHHDLTLALLAGFMIGSLRKVWPWQLTLDGSSSVNVAPPDATAVALALALALAGLAAVLLLERTEGAG